MHNRVVCLGVLVLVAVSAYYAGSYYTKSGCSGDISEQRCSLRTAMRKLWSDHVWWTRNYLIAAIANTPDLKATTERLLKNQEDIGTAIVPYYGKQAGEQLTKLLKEHILIAADVVAAAKAQKTAQLKDADAKWHVNADAIASFLSAANPYWPYDAIKDMMYEHLKLTTQEAVARLKQDWKADIETFEKVFDEIMMMSDSLTVGIVKQFPEKF